MILTIFGVGNFNKYILYKPFRIHVVHTYVERDNVSHIMLVSFCIQPSIFETKYTLLYIYKYLHLHPKLAKPNPINWFYM